MLSAIVNKGLRANFGLFAEMGATPQFTITALSANPDLDEERLSIRSRSWIINFHMCRGKSIKYLYWKFLI